MNVTQESTADLTAVLKLTLTEDDYREAVDKQLKDYRKKANMPGFRPGMVPMGMIKKMYEKSVLVEEVNKMVSEGLNNYIVENKIDVLGHPLPNVEKSQQIDFDKQKEFNFFFDIAFAPEFDLELNDKISVPYYKIKIEKDMVDNAVKDTLVRNGQEEYPETAEENNSLQGKFTEVDEEGNIVEGGIENASFFNISDIKLKTIIKKFVGKKIDDKVVFNPLKAFKDEHKVQHLLGLDHEDSENTKKDYEFTINKIILVKEAELNEELYTKLYPQGEIKTEEDFRAKLAEDLATHYSRDTDRQFLADTVNTLIEKADISLPDEFMKRWLLESNQDKITQEQIDTQYDNYAKTMKWQIIEGKIMKDHEDKVKVDSSEVKDKVKSYFTQMGTVAGMEDQLDQIVNSVLSNQEEYNRIYNDLLDEKYVALFKEHIKFKEKEVDSKKFSDIVSNTK